MLLNRRNWFIGIDGGGTSTRGVLGDESGEILASAVGDSSNMLSRSLPEVEGTLRTLCQELVEKAGGTLAEVRAIFLGLAGADRPREKELLMRGLHDLCPGGLVIDNDAITALYAGTWGKPGIVLIAGTGSIAYGVGAQGERYRVGGWGYLLGDEGSGFSIGQQGLIAVMRAHDGRGKPTLLTGLALSRFGVTEVPLLISHVYGSENPRKAIADAGRMVLEAAEQGDEVALSLVAQAAEELVELVEACQKKMRQGEVFSVVLAGGLMEHDSLVQRVVVERLAERKFTVALGGLSPVYGALIMAMQSDGVELSEPIRNKIREVEVWQKS